MKVYENIERFHRDSPRFSLDTISDEEMRIGLKSIIETVAPYRKEKSKIISQYLKARDELPLTSNLGEGPFGQDLEIGCKKVDYSILGVIFEDRYSFGYLYWYLLHQFDKSEIYKYYDSEAPFRRGLIEYAIDYDLEDSFERFQSFNNLNERYEYATSMLRRSQQEVLVNHPIKDEYESRLSILIEGCRAELNEIDPTIFESNVNKDVDMSAPEEGKTRTGSTRFNKFAIRYVRNPKNRERLMSYLHEQLQDKTNQFALVYIQAAINAGLLSFPSHSNLVDEFGPICKRANYHKLVNEDGGGFKNHKQDVEMITSELKEHFK